MAESQETQIQFSLTHLVALVSMAALHLFVARIAASSHDYATAGLSMAYLLLLGVAVQRMFRMQWIHAAAVLYPLSLIWAPIFGVTYSMFWNQQYGPHRMDWIDKAIPSAFAWNFFEIVLLILGPLTSIVYGVGAWALVRLLSPVHSSPEEDSSQDKSEE